MDIILISIMILKKWFEIYFVIIKKTKWASLTTEKKISIKTKVTF